MKSSLNAIKERGREKDYVYSVDVWCVDVNQKNWEAKKIYPRLNSASHDE